MTFQRLKNSNKRLAVMRIGINKYLLLMGFFFLSFTSWLSASSTLEAVRERGYLSCGVSTGLPGFSAPTENGQWHGLDVDFCRAVAAATLGNADKVRFIPLTAKERFEALDTGIIDVLSRNSSWTLTHEARHQIAFAGVLYFDGQGFMVNTSGRIKSVEDIQGKTICVTAGTTSKQNLDDYFSGHKWSYQPLVLETKTALLKAFSTGQCDAISSDRSQLFSLKSLIQNSDNTRILPEIISKEPLGPAVRRGDELWLDFIRWTLFALISGEEYDIHSDNIDHLSNSSDPNIRSLLILNNHSELGLGPDWVYRILKQVGNYEEIYHRNLGDGSSLKIGRGMNTLWSQGGVLYAPPFR